MKKTKWILALLLFFITLSCFLTVWHIDVSAKINYPFPYQLNNDYVSLIVDKDNENTDLFLDELLDTVKDQPITILVENTVDKELRLFDGLGLYVDNPLFIGYYFKKSHFIEKEKVALQLVDNSGPGPDNEIQKSDGTYKVIGEFDQNYVLAENGATQILPLFSLRDVVGTYFIQCDDNALLKRVTIMFETKLNSSKASKNVISLDKILSYMNEDKQIGIIMVVLFLSFITFVISDYIMLARNKKEFAIRYLVGATTKSLLVKQLQQIVFPFMLSCILSALLSTIIIKSLEFHQLTIFIMTVFATAFFLISTLAHIAITLLLLSEVKREVFLCNV